MRFVFAVSLLLLSPAASQAKQTWIAIRSRHFLIVTNAGEKKGMDTAVHLERIRAFFRQSLAVASHQSSPFVTVLAVKDGPTMANILQQHWGEGEAHIAGFFSQLLDRHLAIVELDVQRKGYYEVFYHEYYHSITSPLFPDMPLWLSEGLAQFYGYTDISNEHVSTGRTDRDSLEFLRHQKLIPLNVLFNVDYRSPYYNEVDKAPVFYAESWLATHYMMVGNPDAHKLLVNYLSALSRGKTWQEAQSEFGDLKQLQSKLALYDRQKRFLSIDSPLPKVNSEEFAVRTLSEAESESYLGQAEAALGHNEQAAVSFTKAIHLDPNSSLAHQGLALVLLREGQQANAMEFATQAIKLDPSDSSARYLRAYCATYGEGMLITDAPVEDDLRQAIILNPELSPAYELLGLYLALRSSRAEEGLSLVKQAIALDSSNSSYQLSMAKVLLQMKRYADAKKATERASVLARSQADKIEVQQLNTRIEQELLNAPPISSAH